MQNAVLTIRLDARVIDELKNISEITKKSKAFIIREAIELYLEDVKDIREADNVVMTEKKEEWVDHDEVKKKYLIH